MIVYMNLTDVQVN